MPLVGRDPGNVGSPPDDDSDDRSCCHNKTIQVLLWQVPGENLHGFSLRRAQVQL
jgi:hypothetical protein